MSTKRISYIDMAKGIGILLVLIGHSAFPSQNLITWIASFHMPLFFIISGMMFSHTEAEKKDWKQFIKRKAQGILIPYATFSVLSILASCFVDYKSYPEYLIILLIQTMSFYGIVVLWFLPALFFGETLFYFIKRNTSHKITLVIALVVLALSILGNELYHSHYAFVAGYIDLLTGYVFVVLIRIGFATSFLAIGYYINYLTAEKKLPRGVYLLISLVFLVLNIWLGFKNGRVDLNQIVFGNYLLYFLAAVCGSLCIICFCKALPEIKPLVFMGKNSLTIMGTHINCKFFGICYMLGDFVLSLLPALGKIGYMIIVIIAIGVLELIAIYVFNRFMPVLIGKRKSVMKK